MPQRKDKWNNSLFADLGRPTKRGIRMCPKCKTVNGTRGNSCKNKACDVVFRDNGKKSTTEACRVFTNASGVQTFSVRLRDRGPDYRNFVELPLVQPIPENVIDLNQKVDTRERGCLTAVQSKCYVDSCIKNKQFPCSHIEASQRCFSESQPLFIKQSTLTTLNIPPDHQQTLSTFFVENSDDSIVQRVSKTSFVVKCTESGKHPLGYLHIIFIKNGRDDGYMDKKFLCACKPPKTVIRDNEVSQSTNSLEVSQISFKFCVHYYACLCAFASDDNLSNEFNFFLAQINQEYAPTLLSQLQLVTLPAQSSTVQVEGLDANHISVEIMQENISLLESIAAVTGDATLHGGQNLEGVLSDQIIVANVVDDSLNFGDATVIDNLDDGDSQVCQIFASPQNAIHLTGGFSSSENTQQTMNITGAILSPSCTKKRRQISGSEVVLDVATISTANMTQPLVSTNHYDSYQKPIHFKGTSIKGFNCTTMITYTTPVMTNVSSTLSPPPPPLLQQPTPPIEPPPSPTFESFEMWLSGVNERINAAMNYQFSGKPDPLVYYISMDYFERLRERITTGVKKKRLPNQTVIITRLDKPPAGIFTKYVWKITNLFHVLQIFQNQIIPLKISQCFIKGNNGVYEEWISPNDDNDKKNQLIKPHVHSTYLKIGKSDPNGNGVESAPFIIEWIPDILPQSRLGELSIIFEFTRCSSSRNEMSATKSNNIFNIN